MSDVAQEGSRAAPHLTINWWTQINLSFTHSRLLKHKAGPGVPPGTFPVEGDLAESWTQPSDTTYVFKLRRGVRWHGKPPVNGRELTADDVKCTYEHAEGAVLLVPGRPGADRNMDRAPGGRRSFRRSPEAGSLIGTGPWMLERVELNVRSTPVGESHQRLGAVRHELHAESRQRLRRPAQGRLAGQISLETAFP